MQHRRRFWRASERGQPCPRVESEAAVRADKAVRAPDANAWSENELGEILTLNYGWSLPEHKRIAGDFPVFGSNGIVGRHNEAFVSSPGVIVGRKGSAGNVHFSRNAFCPIDTTFFIMPSDTELDIEFLYYLLAHIDLKRVLGDVGVPGLNREMAYKERDHFPNERAEPRKIAGVLGLVQRAMEQQERLLALTDELKKTLLHQLFTRGLHHEPQKQTELGPIPSSWEVVELEKNRYRFRLRNFSEVRTRQGRLHRPTHPKRRGRFN